ncbi:MAG TPA: F0F1 ATP synthase subunit delta [Alphaproteobacteria bacterium]|nr:F0F1 ATP synthase subunit delta [Alphaproteobacteria bacterium]
MAGETSFTAGLAGRYATALYELADEAKALDAVAGDLAQLKTMIAGSADLRQMISSPLVPRDQQAKAMLGVVERAGLNDLTRRFVGAVAKNRRLYRMTAIIDAFNAILAERRGEMTAEITSAKPLSSVQADAVGAALRGALGRKVTVDLKVDPRLIGGLKVKVGSRLVDASLASKLQRLQLAMKGLAG